MRPSMGNADESCEGSACLGRMGLHIIVLLIENEKNSDCNGCQLLQNRRRVGAEWFEAVMVRGLLIAIGLGVLSGCSPKYHRESVDRSGYEILREKRLETFGEAGDFTIDTPSNQLRKRLLAEQNLLVSSRASLGSDHLDIIDHWPDDGYLQSALESDMRFKIPDRDAVMLSLEDALGVAARNSREYQSEKEDVFRAALDLYDERDQFGATFSGFMSGAYAATDIDGDFDSSVNAGTGLGVTQRFKNGAVLAFDLGWSVTRLLGSGGSVSDSLVGDASIAIPLLRGSGRHIVTEPLVQAERDMVYALYSFEEFKRGFVVDVASGYLAVLQNQNEVQNAEDNYRSLIASTRRARRLLAAGDLPPIQVDQTIQDELSARNRWVSARESYSRRLDGFKVTIGLPPDARIELDADEFKKLADRASLADTGSMIGEDEAEVPPADEPIILDEPAAEGAGPFELDPEIAIRLAFEHRLDLRISEGNVFDSQRDVVLAADRLRTEITLLGSAGVSGEGASGESFDRRSFDALLNLDLPLERTAEAVAYRNSYINLERSVRSLQSLEDNIKLGIIDRLRELREGRESIRIQALSVELANRRVGGANLNLQAGRVEVRDLLEAQDDLLSAQNSLTAATVDYRIAELSLQRDLGLLEVSDDGLWKEFDPKNIENEESDL